VNRPRHIIPAGEARAEILVVNSRFIASAAPAFRVEEAKDFIARIRQEYADASHNVPAYVIGHGATTTLHCSDAGEPSGTAGRPALAVLQGSGVGDIVVVITRYFGGTKLGTGGLVRAYSNAVRAVLEVMPRGEKIPTHTIYLELPYNLFERVRNLIDAYNGQVLDQDFAVQVAITGRFAVEHFPGFQEALRELSHGALSAEIIDTTDMIVPVSSGMEAK
jgi:uncharacterized YigZ family protein